MELKFTFEDGSSGYLAHYGVKGMKWKNHVAAQKDETKNRKRRALQNAHHVSVSGSGARRAKAKAKAWAASRGRKNFRARGVIISDTGSGTSKKTYY